MKNAIVILWIFKPYDSFLFMIIIYQVFFHIIFKIIFYLKVIWAEGSKLVPPQAVPAGVPYYQLTLSPPVILHNYLPYNIQYSLEVSCLSL